MKHEQDAVIYKKPSFLSTSYRNLSNASRSSIKASMLSSNITYKTLQSSSMTSKPSGIVRNRSLSEPKVRPISAQNFYKSMVAVENESNIRSNNIFIRRQRGKAFERNQTINIIIPNENYSIEKPLFLNSSKLSDKRNLYANSKFSVKRPLTAITHSSEQIDENELSHNSASRVKCLSILEPSRKLNKESTSQTEKPNATSSQQDPNSKSSLINDLNMHKQNIDAIKNNSIKNSNFLDPNWIPVKVQENLIDMHNKLHKKPTLLQLSHISKSESNLKVIEPKKSERSKKPLSLQNSQ